jgi:hypothetical protein
MQESTPAAEFSCCSPREGEANSVDAFEKACRQANLEGMTRRYNSVLSAKSNTAKNGNEELYVPLKLLPSLS